MWNNWEQIRCVAHSPLIVGVTITLLISLSTCIVRIQSDRVNFACTKSFFYLSAEAIIHVRNARLCAKCALFFLKIKQILFLVVWLRGLHFWSESKINLRCFWRCPLSWQVLSQQREMRLSRQLCNNCEIHFWLWKVWSLVVSSQSSFYKCR